MNDERKYVIWSHEHKQWWGPDLCGYTQHLDRAGLYTHAEAAEITIDHFPPGEEVAMSQSDAHLFKPHPSKVSA